MNGDDNTIELVKTGMVILMSCYLVHSTISQCPEVCVCKNMAHGIHVMCAGTRQLNSSTIVLPTDTRKLDIQDIPINQDDIADMLRPLENLEILSLSNTAATEFTWEMFRNLKQLKELRLKKCTKVEKLHENAFQSLVNLRVFYISENEQVNFSDLGRAIRKLSTKNLDVFGFEKQGLKTQGKKVLTTEFYRALKGKSVKIVIKRNNKISRLQSGFSTYLKNLTCLLVNGNIIFNKREFEAFLLDNLRVYDISFNTKFIPDAELNLDNICIEPFPEETEVNDIDPAVLRETEELLDQLCIDVYGLPPNLRFMYQHNVYMGAAKSITTSYAEMTSPTYCFFPSNNLRYIDSYNNAIDYKEPQIGLLRLQYYNIQNCQQSGIPYHTFAHLPSLNTLLMGGNHLGPWFTKGNATFALHGLDKLTSLDLADNHISVISTIDLKYLFTIENVNLSQNSLHSDSFNVLFHGQFKHLNLSNNKLAYLPLKFRQSIDNMVATGNTFFLDLSHNPLQCNCDNLEFLQWLLNNQHIFHNFHHYTCDMDSKQENIHEILQRKVLKKCNSQTTGLNIRKTACNLLQVPQK